MVINTQRAYWEKLENLLHDAVNSDDKFEIQEKLLRNDPKEINELLNDYSFTMTDMAELNADMQVEKKIQTELSWWRF
jgi:hypothetical protein